MNHIKCLFVGAYSSMEKEYEELKQEFDYVDIDFSLYDNIDAFSLDNYDFILSRGGIMERLKKATKTKVFDIGISIYDILNTIDLSKLDKTLIIGFPGITASAKALKKYTNYKLNIITINNNEELSHYKNEILSYQYIYCGYNTYQTIKPLNPNASLIKSSYDTIKQTFISSINFCNAIKEERLKDEILKASLANDSMNVLIYNSKKEKIHEIITLSDEIPLIMDSINSNIDSLIKNKYKKIILETSEFNIVIFNSHFNLFDEVYTSIKIEYHKKIGKNTYIYQAIDSSNTSSLSIDIVHELESYSINNIPIAIFSYPGSLDYIINDLIINKSVLKENTPFIIDFNLVTKSEFKYLLNDTDSILNFEGHIFIFKGLEVLSKEDLSNFFSFIKDINLTKNNKIIFNINLDYKTTLLTYLSQIPFYLVVLKSLNDNPNKKDIINNYLIDSLIYGKLSNESLDLLYDFRYEYNELELIRIINQIKDSNDFSVISISKILSLEHYKYINDETYKNKSLEEIILEAIHYNLVKNNNNQIKASKSLGISRTTMWRYLKANS